MDQLFILFYFTSLNARNVSLRIKKKWALFVFSQSTISC
jgi:hypothetical protein